ncbi:hypothetical protein G7046_g7603 [Stylonectria norvegica]|nr:hypothetical protein G7046_g7603 [Stylonectria norvegica]
MIGSRWEIPDEPKALRRKCRKLLAAHIKKSIGLTVKPEKVRLVTTQTNGYAWSYTAEVAPLFPKNLSEHRMAAYKELCDMVGQSFHAVSSTEVRKSRHSATLPSPSPPATVFSSIINVPEPKLLTADTGELSLLTKRVKVEAVERERLQRELRMANEECERPTQELKQKSERASLNESLFFQCLGIINEIGRLVEKAQQQCSEVMELSIFTD